MKFERWWSELAHELYVLEGFHIEEVQIDWWLHYNNGLSPTQAIRKEFG